jgi:hypothetical protein
MVTGRPDQRNDKLQLIVDELDLYNIDKARGNGNKKTRRQAKSIDIVIPVSDDDNSSVSVVESVYKLLSSNRGDIPYRLSLSTPRGKVRVEFAQAYIQYDQAFEQQVINLVGREHLKVEWV